MLSLVLTAALLDPSHGSTPTSETRETNGHDGPTIDDAARAYHDDRTLLGLSGMGVLTGWAIGNIAVGIAGNLTTTGPTRFFFQGNAAWNTVNLALGIWGLVGQERDRRVVVDLPTGRRKARQAQRTFGINAGLDLVYISAGAIHWSLGEHLSHARVQGYGQALVLQGAFLLAFDVGMMLGHEWLLDHLDPLGRSGRPAFGRLRLRPTAIGSARGRGLTPGLALTLRR